MKSQLMKLINVIFPIIAWTVLTSSCKPQPSPANPRTDADAVSLDVCANADGSLTDAAFIFVRSPASGERVASGFTVSGCSRTFESTVNWRLKARDGRELAAGHTTGGGVDGPGSFSIEVKFEVTERQIGHLEIDEEDASDGEGFPPSRNVIPLVLKP